MDELERGGLPLEAAPEGAERAPSLPPEQPGDGAAPPPEREPGEIVEVYARLPREVVETYTRPLPPKLRWAPAPPRKKKSRKYLLIFAAVTAAVAALAAVAWWSPWRHADPRPQEPYGGDRCEEPEQSGSVALPVYEPETPLSLSLSSGHGPALTAQDVYKRVNPAVVAIQVSMEGGVGLGTGILFTEDGYVLTNYHVVEGGQTCKVLLADSSIYWASYVSGDQASDIAVLKLDGEGVFPTAELGDSSLLTVGDKVYAIGNPLGMELRGTFTDGIISAIDRSVTVDGQNMELIQTNAALNSGNSGGPLINQYGQVVGINTIKMVSSFSNIEGLGFAIPTASIQSIVAELMDSGEVAPSPVLGISISQVGDPLPGGRAGLLIQDVTPGGAADLAGVRVGDYILAAGGQPTSFSSDLYQVRRRFRAGDAMDLTLWRDGEILTVELILQSG